MQILKLADRVDNLRSIQALVMRTGERYRAWAGHYLRRTIWQVLPLAAGAPSVARVALVTAMADLAPLVDDAGLHRPLTSAQPGRHRAGDWIAPMNPPAPSGDDMGSTLTLVETARIEALLALLEPDAGGLMPGPRLHACPPRSLGL